MKTPPPSGQTTPVRVQSATEAAMTEMSIPEPTQPGTDTLARLQRAGEVAAAPGAPSTVNSTLPVSAPLNTLDRTTLYLNRELSWLWFNRRVLEEAQEETNPLLERVKFLAIASSNLDEFFEIRVAGVMELIDAGLTGDNPDGIKPQDELHRIRSEAHAFHALMHRTWGEMLVPQLAAHGVPFREIRQLTPGQLKWVESWFAKEVYPILTPLAVDPAHPFPVLLNKSLNLVVLLADPRAQDRKSVV